jgi:hypothetical protein
MTKTGGTATFTGNVSAGALTINGTGGTLSLGVGLTHTFSGIVSLTNGTLKGGSSIQYNVMLFPRQHGMVPVPTLWQKPVPWFLVEREHQTLSATSTTFNNVTFSGGGNKL